MLLVCASDWNEKKFSFLITKTITNKQTGITKILAQVPVRSSKPFPTYEGPAGLGPTIFPGEYYLTG